MVYTAAMSDERTLARSSGARVRPAARRWSKRLATVARRVTFHTVHPRVQGPWIEADRPVPLRRLHYRTRDGWRAPIRVLEPSGVARGEPIVLAHALGIHPDLYRATGAQSVAARLVANGFRVYLMSHRGDRDSVGPVHRGTPIDFDAILRFDVPAALAAIRKDSGAPRIHWVGHGLGGHLGMAHAARSDDLASIAVVDAPIAWDVSDRSQSVVMEELLHLLPDSLRVPTRAVARLAVPLLDDPASLPAHWVTSSTPGARLRGGLSCGIDDVAVSTWRQLRRWSSTGVWSDRTGSIDYAATLVDATCPAMNISTRVSSAGDHDLQARWGGPVRSVELSQSFGALDVALSELSTDALIEPITRWLDEQRISVWRAA